jgi:hypothetical protein
VLSQLSFFLISHLRTRGLPTIYVVTYLVDVAVICGVDFDWESIIGAFMAWSYYLTRFLFWVNLVFFLMDWTMIDGADFKSYWIVCLHFSLTLHYVFAHKLVEGVSYFGISFYFRVPFYLRSWIVRTLVSQYVEAGMQSEL